MLRREPLSLPRYEGKPLRREPLSFPRVEEKRLKGGPGPRGERKERTLRIVLPLLPCGKSLSGPPFGLLFRTLKLIKLINVRDRKRS